MQRGHVDEPYPPVSALSPTPELPDPFETFDGRTVGGASEWRERRAEIEDLFRHYVYGYAPEPPEFEVAVDRRAVLGGEATLTEATVTLDDLPPDAPSIDVALVTPIDVEPAPIFLGLNRTGNHGVIGDDAVSVTASGRRYGEGERGARSDSWCVERLVERGYGLATFHQADVDPDRDDVGDGLRAYYDPSDLPGPTGTEWGTLAAWAWGLQRAVDYLRTDDLVHDDGIAVVGHSRRGKAALLAGATDERIAMVVPHQSGTGGCATSRNNDQETVAIINESFPHWFNDVFPAFSGRADRLPVDQHLLVALVAPRPLLDTEGARDYWANPGCAYDAVRAAAPVYDMLDGDGLVGDGLLHDDDEITPDTVGTLLQYRREATHTLDRGYWDGILDVADIHLG